MRLKMSMIYGMVFIVAMVSAGIATLFVSNPVSPSIVYPLMGVLAFSILIGVVLFEKQMSFMDLSHTPKIEPEPEVNHRLNIANYIVKELNKNVDLKTITETLQKGGYSVQLITSVLNELISKSIIKVNQEKTKEEKKPKEKKTEKKKVKKK